MLFPKTEKNLKLDEILKKVQQENEDFKARMERHAALSRYGFNHCLVFIIEPDFEHQTTCLTSDYYLLLTEPFKLAGQDHVNQTTSYKLQFKSFI